MKIGVKKGKKEKIFFVKTKNRWPLQSLRSIVKSWSTTWCDLSWGRKASAICWEIAGASTIHWEIATNSVICPKIVVAFVIFARFWRSLQPAVMHGLRQPLQLTARLWPPRLAMMSWQHLRPIVRLRPATRSRCLHYCSELSTVLVRGWKNKFRSCRSTWLEILYLEFLYF